MEGAPHKGILIHLGSDGPVLDWCMLVVEEEESLLLLQT